VHFSLFCVHFFDLLHSLHCELRAVRDQHLQPDLSNPVQHLFDPYDLHSVQSQLLPVRLFLCCVHCSLLNLQLIRHLLHVLPNRLLPLWVFLFCLPVHVHSLHVLHILHSLYSELRAVRDQHLQPDLSHTVQHLFITHCVHSVQSRLLPFRLFLCCLHFALHSLYFFSHLLHSLPVRLLPLRLFLCFLPIYVHSVHVIHLLHGLYSKLRTVPDKHLQPSLSDTVQCLFVRYYLHSVQDWLLPLREHLQRLPDQLLILFVQHLLHSLCRRLRSQQQQHLQPFVLSGQLCHLLVAHGLQHLQPGLLPHVRSLQCLQHWLQNLQFSHQMLGLQPRVLIVCKQMQCVSSWLCNLLVYDSVHNLL
jgi:hypothetical protein